jgi:excisionase family DNA binding protein
MPATPAPDLLPCAAVAAELGVTPDHVAALVARGRLPGVRPSPRCLLLRRRDVDAFLAARAAHAAAAAKAPGLSVREVAHACNVEPDTVRRWIRLGLLPAKLAPAVEGFRAYRVLHSDLRGFLDGAST